MLWKKDKEQMRRWGGVTTRGLHDCCPLAAASAFSPSSSDGLNAPHCHKTIKPSPSHDLFMFKIKQPLDISCVRVKTQLPSSVGKNPLRPPFGIYRNPSCHVSSFKTLALNRLSQDAMTESSFRLSETDLSLYP